MAELKKISCEGDYAVYHKTGMYCFIRKKYAEESASSQEEPDLRERITLQESFDAGGKYVFCGADATDDDKEKEQRFINDVGAYFGRQNLYIRFLWIENPEETAGLWRVHALIWDAIGKTAQARSVMLGRYRLMIERGSSLRCQKDSFYFEREQEEKNGLEEKTQSVYYFDGPDIRLAGSGKLCLETEGDSCGAFYGTFISDDRMLMQKLEAGICFSCVREEDEDDSFKGFIHSAINPVLFPESSLTIDMKLSVHALFDEKRTRFRMNGARFMSGFSSALGQSVYLEAKEDAALVFLERPVRAYRTKEGVVETKKVLYLGFSGHFKRLSDTPCILCGLTGTENVKTGEKEETDLCFVPFMPGVAPYSDTASGTASWIKIGGNVSYFCQPEASALYAADKDIARNGESYLRLLEIAEAKFCDNMPPVPMMPYRNIRMLSEDNAPGWEEEIYRKRREILTGRVEKSVRANECANADMDADGPEELTLSVSHQGIMAQTDTDGNFRWLGFARVSFGTGLPDMRFCEVDAELRERFMQKQFFYIFNAKEDLARMMPSEGFVFSVEGILFQLLPENWISGRGNKNTILLLKYAEDKAAQSTQKQT